MAKDVRLYQPQRRGHGRGYKGCSDLPYRCQIHTLVKLFILSRFNFLPVFLQFLSKLNFSHVYAMQVRVCMCLLINEFIQASWCVYNVCVYVCLCVQVSIFIIYMCILTQPFRARSSSGSNFQHSDSIIIISDRWEPEESQGFLFTLHNSPVGDEHRL